MILGGIEGILDEGNAIGTRFEHRLPLLGREVDQERYLLEDGFEGGLYGLYVGGGEVCVHVLVGHGGAPWGCVWFLCGCGADKQGLVECVSPGYFFYPRVDNLYSGCFSRQSQQFRLCRLQYFVYFSLSFANESEVVSLALLLAESCCVGLRRSFARRIPQKGTGGQDFDADEIAVLVQLGCNVRAYFHAASLGFIGQGKMQDILVLEIG